MRKIIVSLLVVLLACLLLAGVGSAKELNFQNYDANLGNFFDAYTIDAAGDMVFEAYGPYWYVEDLPDGGFKHYATFKGSLGYYEIGVLELSISNPTGGDIPEQYGENWTHDPLPGWTTTNSTGFYYWATLDKFTVLYVVSDTAEHGKSLLKKMSVYSNQAV